MRVDIDQKCGRPQSGWTIGLAVFSVLMDTAVVFGLLAWLYVATIGIVRPNDLPLRIVSSIPVRRDTTGIFCIGLSAVAYFFREALQPTGKAGMPNSRSRTIARASLRTLFVYSTMVAIYLMVQTVTHPETLTMQLTHLLNWPTERPALVVALLCSITSFILLRTSTYMSKLHNGRDPN
jgi:hypothetical protein